jgi:hypothetical protein
MSVSTIYRGKLREADCVPHQPGGARSSENPGHRPYRASIEEMKTPLHDGLICSSSFIAAQIGFFVSSHARVRPLT